MTHGYELKLGNASGWVGYRADDNKGEENNETSAMA